GGRAGRDPGHAQGRDPHRSYRRSVDRDRREALRARVDRRALPDAAVRLRQLPPRGAARDPRAPRSGERELHRWRAEGRSAQGFAGQAERPHDTGELDRNTAPPRRYAPPRLVRGGESFLTLPSSSRRARRDSVAEGWSRRNPKTTPPRRYAPPRLVRGG